MLEIDNKIRCLKNFKEHHEKYYYNRLKEYNRDNDKVSIIETFLKNLIDSTHLCMCVPINALESIIKDNRFKSMNELGKGTTLGGVEIRQKVTELLFHAKVSNLKDKDYPKYGFLLGKDKLRDLMIDLDVIWHYGEVIIIFKKENLIRRTTMTIGTSLDFGECYTKCPTSLINPTITCLRGKSQSINKSSLLQVDSYNEMNQFYKNIISKKLDYNLPATLPYIYDGKLGYENYELQFHGRLEFFKDVEEVCLFPNNEESNEKFKMLMPKISEHGIKCTIIGSEF